MVIVRRLNSGRLWMRSFVNCWWSIYGISKSAFTLVKSLCFVCHRHLTRIAKQSAGKLPCSCLVHYQLIFKSSLFCSNTGIFYGLYETRYFNSSLIWSFNHADFFSLIWGNTGFFFILHGSDGISTTQRYAIFGFLLALAIIGTILVTLLYRKQARKALQPSDFARQVLRCTTYLRIIKFQNFYRIN